MYYVRTKFEWKLTKPVQDITFSKKQDDCQVAIFDMIVKKIVMDMYPNMYNVRTKFEQKLSKHIQDSTISKKQDGRQSAIFDPIMKSLHMRMSR